MMETRTASSYPCSCLPDETSWRFDEIERCDTARAEALRAADPPEALLDAVEHALDAALSCRDVRIGREHVDASREDYRAVVQFRVGVEVFDWFFNARTGYRAHFRPHHACGLVFNCQIIERLRLRIAVNHSEIFSGRELNCQFEDCGEARIPKSFLISSLEPYVSKVWMCTKRIGPDGGIDGLPLGVGGPRILLDDDESWAAPYREDDAAWLDVKGGFLGNAGAYQPKDPIARAKVIQDRGTA